MPEPADEIGVGHVINGADEHGNNGRHGQPANDLLHGLLQHHACAALRRGFGCGFRHANSHSLVQMKRSQNGAENLNAIISSIAQRGEKVN